ncbi:GNAT family N-acetyltransferase [Shewanella submarina]|uniref:GNAT family N-acetyltransferase n=1 Tax=Shewanella submarina TaxID=2016376 RepID=A0ABV7G722_9GAMM|nr:GNAT family N-acetyltransferase [Shewanella submarina]MCL1037282.1 GNAT family N-acetyltransferase [Shewanella submarina]
MEIIHADICHLNQIATLFNDYRVFYHCQSDLELAREFIAARLNNNESVIFLAVENDRALGFTQLYPSFCSVEACKIVILYDLYVAEDARKSGVATGLMNAARAYAEGTGARRMDLSTQNTNLPGQHLYEKQGYQRSGEDFYIYSLYL